ncbi:ATPase with role in protein import into the ER [Trifolium repens]|nr:ATPase with role in protein import into the ER [Trifolium repens]
MLHDCKGRYQYAQCAHLDEISSSTFVSTISSTTSYTFPAVVGFVTTWWGKGYSDEGESTANISPWLEMSFRHIGKWFSTPSFVAFTDDQRLVGDAAKNQAASNPENTVFDAKSQRIDRICDLSKNKIISHHS